jgi:hypothetical protein
MTHDSVPADGSTDFLFGTSTSMFDPLRIHQPLLHANNLSQSGRRALRKSLIIFIVVVMLSVATPTFGRTCGRLRHRHGNYSHTHSSCIGDRHRHGRSFWQKHRDKLTTAIGAGAGAAIGGAAAEAKVLRSVRLLVVAEPRFIPTAFASAEGVHATDVVTP